MNNEPGADEAVLMNGVFNRGDVHSGRTPQLSRREVLSGRDTLRGDHAVNDANVNAYAGRMPPGQTAMMLMLIS